MPVLAAFGDTRLDADLAKILQGVSHAAQTPRAISLMSLLHHLYASRRASATVAIALGLAAFAGTAMLPERSEPYSEGTFKVGAPPRHRVVTPASSEAEQTFSKHPTSKIMPLALPASPRITEAAARPMLTAAARPMHKRRTKPTASSKADILLAQAPAVSLSSPAQGSLSASSATDAVSAAVTSQPDAASRLVEASDIPLSSRRVRRDSVDAIRALRRQ